MRIVCIGDSLTYCSGWIDNSSPIKSFCNRLSEKFPGIDVVNLGINADITSNMVSRKADVLKYSPFRVIVWGGINDLNGLPPSTVQNNLQSLYTYYKGFSYEVWAVTITQKDDSTPAVNSNKLLVNDWIRNTALNVDKVIDAWTITTDPSDMTKRLPLYAVTIAGNQNHINDAGYEAIINSITGT